MKINFARHAYQSRSKPLSSQRLVNLYGEVAPEDAKESFVLYGTPGLKLWTSVPKAPIRGSIKMGGLLYVVGGDTVYKITKSGSASAVGTLGQSGGRVDMSANATQISIVEDDNSMYVATSSSVVKVTDGDFGGASSVTYIDSYTLVSTPDSHQFQISALNDSTSYSALDVGTAEGNPDELVRVFADHREIFMFGEETTEVFYNSGNADFPIERRTFIERGCNAKFSVAKMDNTIYWLGDDLVVYRMNGYTPESVSTHAIEFAIEEMTTTDDAYAFSYTQEGHKFYCLIFPIAKKVFVYDISTGLWHERETYLKNRWLADSYTFVYDKHIVGDFESGNLYELDLDTYTDNGDTIQRIATGASLFNDGDRFCIDRLRVDFESGTGLTTGQGSDPQAMLELSADGGRTWGNEKWRDIGNIGEYKDRAVWRRLGQYRECIPRLTVSDGVKVAITGAYVDVRVNK